MNVKTSLVTVALGIGAIQGLNACSADAGGSSDSTDEALPKDPIDPPDDPVGGAGGRGGGGGRGGVGGVGGGGGSGSGPATPRVMDFVTTQIVETQVDVNSGTLIKYETRNCTPGADPIMHLFQPDNYTSERVQTAIDDNSAGGVNARISFTPSWGGIGFLVLRAKQDAFGSCDIWRNGYPWRYGIAVGGKTVSVNALTADVVETVTMPNGWDHQTIYRLSGANITSKIQSGTGTGGSARFSLSTGAGSFLVSGGGPTRVVVNDWYSDGDADGLGNRLEEALGTCSGINTHAGSFDCSLARTPKDTDGDGISDGVEVIGKRDQQPHQLLPRWGANPRHKDLFVEVDFLDDGSAPLRMPTWSVQQVAAYWQDTIEATTPQTQLHRAGLVKNPDQRPGFALHVDTGEHPASATDSTLYGNWGGYSVLPAGSSYSSAWVDYMSPARRGVFHWVLGVRTGAGQANGFPVIASVNNPAAMAHEIGHTMGLGHEGAPSAGALNCKPQYASPMNYAYAYSGLSFSDGTGPGQMNNRSLLEFGVLANTANKEHFADLYQSTFGYYVDRATWSVDFDRDGDIAPSNLRVRAYANNKPGGDCEGTRERRTVLTQGPPTPFTPAIVRLGSRILVFSASATGLDLAHGSDTYFNCVAGGGGNGNMPCGTFGAPTTIIPGPVPGVDAVTLDTFGGEKQVLVTYVDAQSALQSALVTFSGSTPIVTGIPGPLFQGVSGEPAIAADNPFQAVIVFKAQNGELKRARYAAGVGWTPVTAALGPTGQPFTVSDAPGIVFGRMPGDANDALYLHAEHTALGSASTRLLKLDVQGRWISTPFFGSATANRPGLAYVPNADASKGTLYAVYAQRGSRVLSMRTSGVRVSTVNGVIQKTPTFDFVSSFDNVWATARGVDLMFERGYDTNLRAGIVFDFGDWKDRVVFQPLADGIVDVNYGDFEDWSQIGRKACAAVANPGNLVSNPVPCF